MENKKLFPLLIGYLIIVVLVFIIGMIAVKKMINRGAIKVPNNGIPIEVTAELENYTDKVLVPFGRLNDETRQTENIEIKYRIVIPKVKKKQILRVSGAVSLQENKELGIYFNVILPDKIEVDKDGKTIIIKITLDEPNTLEEYQKIINTKAQIEFKFWAETNQ